ncbi:hypothetical protein AbraIFM66951_004732 [Aspergillus brasiliensis]|uniref:Ubiquitin 3 binding protein But2 C-terminal domain-containing protein n=1 Tax=Aspergillus brasiliensis TaxID=319629 RepID=A0A9W5YH60_9EURO|nr:hypothetical protein AbraCBS73388_008355 [Aspergillus brasiliensis]GKZ43486.1 hypothetical protein AbraIFM66951_004732 [Aspergillus brasiliensis]
MKLLSPMITTLTLFTSMALTSPTPANLIPRACTTITPTAIDILDSANPDTASIGQQFSLSRTPTTNTKISALTFTDIPTDATGCMLAIDIPPALAQPIATGSSTQADIWTTSPWNLTTSSPLPTWNNPPARQEMVSTYEFPTSPSTSPVHRILASNRCSNTMSFLAVLSTWQTTSGSVDFENSIGGSQSIGFSLVFNC